MGDLEEEFKTKLPDWAVTLLTKKPNELDVIIDTEIDKITSLAEAKTFLRIFTKRTVRVIWFLISMIVKGK